MEQRPPILCDTGAVALTGVYNFSGQSGISRSGGPEPLYVVPQGNALCAVTSGAKRLASGVALLHAVLTTRRSHLAEFPANSASHEIVARDPIQPVISLSDRKNALLPKYQFLRATAQ
jgi:hypothetical protein